MADTGKSKVLMNLIGDNEHIMLEADICHALQFLGGPDPAHWVMGAAENKELDGIFLDLGLEILKIYSKSVALSNQGVFYQFTAIAKDSIGKGRVYRGLDENSVPWAGKGVEGQIDGGHHSGNSQHPFFFNVPIIPPLHPAL